MIVRLRVAAALAGLVAAFALAAPCAEAAPASAVIKKIEALNAQAIAAYEAGDNAKAKSLLLDAVVLAKENGLGDHKSVARSNLNLGLVHLQGFKDEAKGERYFTAALRIDPGIKMKAGAGNDPIARVFERARAQAGQSAAKAAAEDAATGAGDPFEEPKFVAAAAAEARADAKAEAKAEAMAKDSDKAREKEAKAEREKILGNLAEARDKEARDKEKETRLREQRAREERDKILIGLAETREREAKAREEETRSERDKLRQDLGAALEREKRERDEKAKLEAQKAKLEAELARIDGQRRELEKQLAAARDRDLKTQDERQRFERERKDERYNLERSAADEKRRLEKERQAEKERLEKEKQELARRLGETEQREKNERLAKEQLEAEKRQRIAEAKAAEQAAREREEKERLERARLAEGPELPARLPQKLTCTTQDSHLRGADVFIHCAGGPQLGAEDITLHYRPSGSARFHSMAMERSKKGWHVAMIPAALVKGSMLQYYAEAATTRGKVVARNGKPEFPNVVMVNRYPTPGTAAPASELVKAGARTRSGRTLARDR